MNKITTKAFLTSVQPGLVDPRAPLVDVDFNLRVEKEFIYDPAFNLDRLSGYADMNVDTDGITIKLIFEETKESA